MKPLLREQESTLSADNPKVRDILAARSDELLLRGDYAFEDPKTDGKISSAWRISRNATGLNVRGCLEGTLELTCGRCLENFLTPASLEIDEQFVFLRFRESTDEKEQELQEEDWFETLDEEGCLDLRDLAYQFLVLAFDGPAECGQPECRIPYEET